MRVCYSHYSLFFYSLFLFASQIRLIIPSASFHLTMKSLTLLRFAFAYNMSKIVIITKDREIAYRRRVRTYLNSVVSKLSTLNSELNLVPYSRKEVFQPHLPVRLPCYDLAPITSFALGRSSR